MPPTAGSAQRILMVEDDPLQSRIYERVLRGGNYEVEVYSEPLAFLGLAGGAESPDLLLIDILLPGIDGLSVCARVAQDPDWCRVPTVLMTAAPGEELARAAERLPVPPEAFLAKPFDGRTLLRCVRRVLAAEDPLLRLRRAQRLRLSLAIRLQQHLLRGPCGESDHLSPEPPAACSDDREPELVRLRAALEAAASEIDRLQATVLRAEPGAVPDGSPLSPASEAVGSDPPRPAHLNPISRDSKSLHRQG